MRTSFLFFLFVFVNGSLFAAGELRYPAAKAERNEQRTVLVDREDFSIKQGVALKSDVEEKPFSPEMPPDLVFTIQAPNEGRYQLLTFSGLDEYGATKMKAAKSKFESLMIGIALDDSPAVERVVFVPWHNAKSVYRERTIKYTLTGKPQTIKIWLPRGVQLDFLELRPYTPPKVPPAAAAYKPKIVPPETRPRLWVNAESLPIVRQRLSQGENAPIWKKYHAEAKKPFPFQFTPGTEIKYDAKLESAAVAKAFAYLMTGDKLLGKEAVALIRDYFTVVSFGNYLDITREIGRAIYSGALVYDWCYDLMTPADRESIHLALLRLADDMEMGWPPFIGIVVNGHGNEMQLSRDLLAMAIALYGDDSVPYQYCSYRVLEELLPMLAYQYQSPRHHQGISYGPFRFECDMTAAWFFYRMTGKKVFHENIENVPLSWIYMRLPDGSLLPDGDGSYTERTRSYANLLNYTYSANPILKGEHLRQSRPGLDPMRWLLLNDPGLAPEPSLESLPRTIDFGPILCGMIARTGWNRDAGSADIVVEMKGGGKHFGNHQHSDAGSFQIYFRGMQAGDLGVYGFYGTPYDMNFNKRSVSHSMMLVYDPKESFGAATSRSTIGNDGGAILHLRAPTTPQQAQNEARHRNGTHRASAFGPDVQKPLYSYFSVDLVGAYSAKIKEYVRSFCFLEMENEKVPGVLLVYDNIITADPRMKKYWQINTFNPPKPTAMGIRMQAERKGLKGRVELSMLLPAPSAREIEILSGKVDAHRVFGVQYEPPGDNVQSRGSRVLFSPKQAKAQDEFLTVMQMVDGEASPLPVSSLETPLARVVVVGDRVVAFAKSKRAIDKEWTLEVPGDTEYKVILTGLAAGKWRVRQQGKEELFDVTKDKTTLYVLARGSCQIIPQDLVKE